MAVIVSGFAAKGQGPSTADGVYTQEQAERGRAQYDGACASCHGMAGAGSDVGPALTGSYFLETWSGVPLNDLFQRVRSTMPASAPGSLSPQAYVDVIAYLLQVNKFPAGQEELKAAEDALKAITITVKK
jgi:mono/diheme cytochrome c family protein